MLKGTLSHMKDRSLKRIGAARPSWVCLRRFGAPPLANSFAFGYLWLPFDTLHTTRASLVHSVYECVRFAKLNNPNALRLDDDTTSYSTFAFGVLHPCPK